MNERQLRYMACIAREKSTKQASIVLEKNPSTLTRMMRKVEEELGVRIFRRSAAGLFLTPEGEQVLDFAGRILTRLDELDGYRREKTAGTKKRRFWTENEILYLLTIREHKKISRAAEQLFLAQPSLSQVLREVESDLEAEVFCRSKDGVEETEFGSGVLDRLEVIQSEFMGLRREMEKFHKMKKGTVTLGIPMSLGSYLLPLFLPTFMDRYPGIRVMIRERSNVAEMERLLMGGKADFCIMHSSETQNSLEYEHLFDDPFVLVIPQSRKEEYHFPENRKLGKEDLSVLKDAPFIMMGRHQDIRQVAQRILERAEVEPFIRCTTRSMETAKRLVAAGVGVSFLPHSYLNLYSGIEDLVTYPLEEELQGRWSIVIACPRSVELREGARELLAILRDCVKML